MTNCIPQQNNWAPTLPNSNAKCEIVNISGNGTNLLEHADLNYSTDYPFVQNNLCHAEKNNYLSTNIDKKYSKLYCKTKDLDNILKLDSECEEGVYFTYYKTFHKTAGGDFDHSYILTVENFENYVPEINSGSGWGLNCGYQYFNLMADIYYTHIKFDYNHMVPAMSKPRYNEVGLSAKGRFLKSYRIQPSVQLSAGLNWLGFDNFVNTSHGAYDGYALNGGLGLSVYLATWFSIDFNYAYSWTKFDSINWDDMPYDSVKIDGGLKYQYRTFGISLNLFIPNSFTED
jgi:hypothetical protein